MTDQERKMLKSYLTECLEPQLDFAKGHSADRYFAGMAAGVKRAMDCFRELFEEDLKEGE